MATDLIGEYLARLRRSLGDRPGSDDMCAEAEDHLREATSRLELKGVPPAEAQRRTLASFGDAGIVARSFRVGGADAALASRTSRLGGTAAVVASAAWTVSLVLGMPYVMHDDIFDAGPWWYFGWSSAVVIATIATTVAVVGMLARGGRQRSPMAFVAVACCTVAVVSLALFTWGWSLGALFLTAGVAIGCSSLRSAGLADARRDVLLIAAWPVAFAVLLIGDDVIGIGRADSYGDHPLATVVAFAVGAAMFAAGLVRFGRDLRAESLLAVGPDPAPATG